MACRVFCLSASLPLCVPRETNIIELYLYVHRSSHDCDGMSCCSSHRSVARIGCWLALVSSSAWEGRFGGGCEQGYFYNVRPSYIWRYSFCCYPHTSTEDKHLRLLPGRLNHRDRLELESPYRCVGTRNRASCSINFRYAVRNFCTCEKRCRQLQEVPDRQFGCRTRT